MKSFSKETLNFFFRKFWASYILDLGKTKTYAIMKTICPTCYHHNGLVATHALGHMMHIMCPSA